MPRVIRPPQRPRVPPSAASDASKNPPINIIFVRHGESEYNAAMRDGRNWNPFSSRGFDFIFRNRCDPNLPDPELTQKGRRQAYLQGKFLSGALDIEPPKGGSDAADPGVEVVFVHGDEQKTGEPPDKNGNASPFGDDVLFYTSPLYRAAQTSKIMLESAYQTAVRAGKRTTEY